METLRTCLCLDATFPETRSHSTRRRQEIEARNVCQWLCMAGFPQYVQMFQDSCGTFNLTQVEKDHQFLDAMSLKLLLSQIAYLNQLSSNKVSIELSKEELSAGSDGEDDHVLSDQWTCQTEGGRRWVHKFLPQSRIASGHQKLSRGGSSLDDATAASSKISSVKPLFRCLSSGPVPSAQCSNSESLPVGHPKVRSSSLSGKGVKRSSFFSREHSNAAPLSRDSSVSDSESMSESLPVGASWSGVDQSTFRSSFRNIFRRSGSHRGRNTAAGHGRPPNAPSVSKADIGCPVFVGSPETEEKMDKLHCVSINSAAIQALPAEMAESDVPVVSACNNNFGSACESGCTDSCSVINGHQCIITTHKHNSLSLSSILENGFRESAVQNSGLKKNVESELPVFNVVDNLVVRNYSACAMDANGLLCIQKVGDHGADDHLSVYDNLTDSAEDKSLANPQLELDLILAELYRNIESLNETLQDVENPYSGADSDCVFEEAAPSQILDNDRPLSQQSHVSELVISTANGTVAISDCQNDFKSDCTSADADNRHPNVGDATSGLNGGKRNDENIPDSLPVWSNDAKYPSTVIPESVKYVKNVDDNNSNGKAKDCSSDAKVNAVRPETPQRQNFSQDHQWSFKAECGNLSCMTSCQMARLYKLNLIKLTSILEKYVLSVPFSWFRNKSKPVSRSQQGSGVFGRSLLNNLQEIGSPLPPWVILAMQRIRRCAAEAIGIFRKSGVRSRIQKFRDQIQSEPDSVNFESLQIYDVADLLKLYFRELPDCLLTRPLSQIFVSIFRNVSKDLQLEAIRACIVLMPDENREVLQCLLFLLLDLSAFANKNQMTASNLAICFAPSLFHVYGIREILPTLSDKPARRKGVKGGEGGGGGNQKLTPPISQNELHEQQAAQECLTFMISNAKELFSVSCDILDQCNVLQLDCLPFNHPFDKSSLEIYRAHLQLMADDIIQESSENFRDWSSLLCVNNVELSYKKQEHPLRLWRCCVEVSASPQDVLTQIQRQRHLWDRDLIDECIVDRLDANIDLCRYTFGHTPLQIPRTFCVLRLWNTKLPNDACLLVSASIKNPESMVQGSICGTVFTSSYLIESLGMEKSRVIFISQVDLRGYSPRWYRKAYGYLCVNLMASLRDSLNVHRQTKV